MRQLVEDLRAEWRGLDDRIAAFDAEFMAMAREDALARRLSTIPGIGPINATALVAAVGVAQSFGRGRDLAAWLGRVPRQATMGGRPKLLGRSKRGNRQLRANLIHGARAVLPRVLAQDTPLGRWAHSLSTRAHKNMRFLRLGLEDPVRDARTIWLFREQLTRAGAITELFADFDAWLKGRGYLAMSGQIVDASIIAAPEEHRRREGGLKEGRIPEDWAANPANLAQKDRDARWTLKRVKARKAKDDGTKAKVEIAIPVFGYKNHISIAGKNPAKMMR